jgi:hypothetical protein
MAKLEFPLDKIKSVTEARNSFNSIVEKIENDPQGKFLLTKGGKPSVVLVNAEYLEKLIGEKPVSSQEPEQKIAAPPPLPAVETPNPDPTQTPPSPPQTAQSPTSGEQEKTLPPQYPSIKPPQENT